GAHVLGFANVDPKTAKILSGITIKEPLITEVVFPPLDRSITQQPGSIDVSMIADFSNVSATAPTIKLPTQALPAWMTSDFTITIGNGTPSPNATSPITIDVPRDSKSGAPIAKPTFGKPIHLYFPASALSAIDAWKKSKKGSNVKITYLSTTKSPLFDLVLQSCVPTTETFSGIVDTVVACTSASFDVRFF
ncbi:MAG TPA: hypothetical protein VF407_17725, partial [Polyangiaceae bacterium]